MCRTLLVGRLLGYVYDSFQQMLGLPLRARRRRRPHLRTDRPISPATIAVRDHCYGLHRGRVVVRRRVPVSRPVSVLALVALAIALSVAPGGALFSPSRMSSCSRRRSIPYSRTPGRPRLAFASYFAVVPCRCPAPPCSRSCGRCSGSADAGRLFRPLRSAPRWVPYPSFLLPMSSGSQQLQGGQRGREKEGGSICSVRLIPVIPYFVINRHGLTPLRPDFYW